MVDERSGPVHVTIVLSEASDRPITVRCSVTGGTATPDTDFMLDDVAVGFSPGETEKTITVTIVRDTLEEPHETIVLGLQSPTGAELGLAKHTLIISADILPRVTFAAAASSADENAATKIDVSLDMASTRPVSVDYSIAGSAFSGADYGLTSGTLVFPPGTTVQQLAIAEVDDALDEDSETVVIQLTNPVEVIVGAIGSTTHSIVDNDAEPVVSFQSPTVIKSEVDVNTTATVVLSAMSGRTVTVPYAMAAATAGAGDVTVGGTGTVTFAPGEISHDIPITIINDVLDEDDETLQLSLGPAVNATIGAGTYTLTIADDDPMPTVVFSTAATTASESGGNVVLTVNLSAMSGRTVTVPFDAAATSTAAQPADYSYGSTVALSFPAGTTQRTITISITEDALDEANELVITNLLAPTNATLGAIASHTLTITDNDPLPSVSFDPAENDGMADEGNNGQSFFFYSVVLSAPSGRILSVPINFSGTATNPGDYSVRAGDVPVVFAPGEVTHTIRLSIVTDMINEPGSSETITMQIPSNGSLTDVTQGTPSTRNHVIVDDD